MMLPTSTVISSFLPNLNHLFNILVVMSLKRFIAKYIFENSPQTYHQQCLSFLMYWLNNFITRTQAYFFTEMAYGKWMKKLLLFLVLLKLISWYQQRKYKIKLCWKYSQCTYGKLYGARKFCKTKTKFSW